jgi:hypothetical protein
MFNIFFKDVFKDTDMINVTREGQSSSNQPLSLLYTYLLNKLFNTSNVASGENSTITSGTSGKVIFSTLPNAGETLSVFVENNNVTDSSNVILFNPKYSNVGVGDVSLTCYTTFDKSIEISLQNTTGVQATGTVEIFYLILD